MSRVRVVIHGRVQGVWYRGWTVETAIALGLTGWVRNRRDGSVEALFVGPQDRIDDMLARCRQGPRAARVASVEPSPEAVPNPLPVGFDSLPTA